MRKKPLFLKKNKVFENSNENDCNRWKVLIVDDEEEIHAVTKLILSNLEYKGRKLEFFDAYSASEAKAILIKQADIAVILLDVVMETDNAGLELTKTIREQLENKNVRIILRTGQPGHAPEERVIIDYDINDYKSKNELTAGNLQTTIIASLRSYEGICAFERNRKGLERIIAGTDELFELESLKTFSSAVLTQLSGFLGCQPAGIMYLKVNKQTMSAIGNLASGELNILGASGEYIDCDSDDCLQNCVDKKAIDLVRQSLDDKKNIFIDDYAVLYLDAKELEGSVAILHGVKGIDKEDIDLLTLFAKKISLALENIVQYRELIVAKEAAATDYLTGLANRRCLIDAGSKLVATYKRLGLSIAVAMIDIDHFKQINDQYGHDVGDEVLKIVSNYMKGRVRESDLIARYGGEEFCLIVTNISGADVSSFFNKIQMDISQLPVNINEKNISLTVSIGVSVGMAEIDEMIKCADSKLYQAKQTGRNRVVC